MIELLPTIFQPQKTMATIPPLGSFSTDPTLSENVILRFVETSLSKKSKSKKSEFQLLHFPVELLQKISDEIGMHRERRETRDRTASAPAWCAVAWSRVCKATYGLANLGQCKQAINDEITKWEDRALRILWPTIKQQINLSDSDESYYDSEVITWFLENRQDVRDEVKILFYYDRRKIKVIPSHLTMFTNLQSLGLYCQGITRIPNCIAQLSQLDILDLQSNQIANIPPECCELPYLKVLNLTCNKVTLLPAAFINLVSLEYLYLNENSIREIPGGLCKIPHLKELSLNTNKISEISKKIYKVSSLQYLSLNDNQITSFPITSFWKKKSKLDNLTYLDLSHNLIKQIPSPGKIKNLIKLKLYDNCIKEIPFSISQLRALKKLHLGKNQIKEIPTVLGQLSNLYCLNLCKNQIETLPSQIGGLTSLEKLILHNNSISFLPNQITQLSKLTFLTLAYNQFRSFPIQVSFLPELECIWLRCNDIAEIPPKMARFKNLRFLDLKKNHLKIFPSDFDAPHLETLNLSSNQLQSFPEMRRILNLVILHLKRNFIKSLPSSVHNLQSLQKLCLEFNQIETVSKNLLNVPHLRDLYLHGNPLVGGKNFNSHTQIVRFLMDLRSNQWDRTLMHANH